MSQIDIDSFNPALHFLGIIQSALLDAAPRRCRLESGIEVYLIPAEQNYYTTHTDIESLQPLCLAPPHEISVQLLAAWPLDDFQDLHVGRVLVQRKRVSLRSRPLGELLWYASLCASRGRLLAGHDTKTPVRLNASPDFSQLYHEDSHKVLAQLMRSQSLTLPAIALQTALPLAQVIDFYNACSLQGLMSMESYEVFKPENYLLGLLAKAYADGQVRCCVLGESPPLYVVPAEDKYYTQASSVQLMTLCATPLAALEISVLADEGKEALVQVGRTKVRQKKPSPIPKTSARPLVELQFQTALQASQGRLLSGYSLTMRVKLKQWPDKSLLKDAVLNKEERYFFSLALFMSDKFASFSEITSITQVPLAKVIDFHNACAVIGLIETAL